MIAILILLVSVAALVQFFLSYVRSLLLASAQQTISPLVLAACSLDSPDVTAGDFHRLRLRAQLCTNRDGDGSALLAVRVYFNITALLRLACGPLVPQVAHWSELQQAACARFALAALDRRLIAPASASA